MGENQVMARTKSKLQAATLGGSPDDVEAVFYEGLRTGDLEKLMTCWSDEDDIVCIHPGGPRLLGAATIRAAFEAMFANGGAIAVRPEHIHRVDALASAVHHVLERVDITTPQGAAHAYVLATNVYHKTAQGWRMVVHHASPGTVGEAQEISHAPNVLH
jgi:ketosteroid isomerase-like protein